MSDSSGVMPTTHIIFSLIGPDRPGLVEEVAKTIFESGCNLEDSRMTVFFGFCCMHLACSGNWKTLGKLESYIPRMERETGMALISRRSNAEVDVEPGMAYSVDVVALDQPGIVRALSGFFTQRGVNIRDMQTKVYRAQQTGTPMFTANLVVDLPVHQHLASLRGDFLDFCDELNLDGVMDPIKA